MGVFLSLFFLIWPFGAVTLSIAKYSQKWTKNIIWAFVIFYASLFVLSNDTMDANRILEKFDFFLYNDMSLDQVFKYFYFENEDGVDIIQPVILYITAKFTDNFQILMAILGVILGFFYSRNISYLFDNSSGKIVPFNYLLIWMFVFVIGFWEVNMFRFWTSALAFFYAIIPYLYEGKKNKLWLLALIPFLHFSFLLPVSVFFVYLFIRNNPKVVFYLFLFSFFLTSINTEVVGDLLMRFLPANFHVKIAAYTSASYAAEVASAETSMSKYLRLAMFALINASFVILYYGYRNEIAKRSNLSRFFTFSLLIMAVGNFASNIPSGDRFQYLSALFSISFLFFFIQKFGIKGKFRIFMHLSAPLMFLASFGLIRLALNTIDILVIIGNPIIAPFIETQQALIDLIR